MTTVSSTSTAADRLRGLFEVAAERVTERFFAKHPEYEQRFGTRGHELCRQDVRYHMEYLTAALDIGEMLPFCDYVRWVARVLEPRGIPRGHIAESLELLGDFLGEVLPPEDAVYAGAAITAGRQAAADIAAPPAYLRYLARNPENADELLRALITGDQAAAIRFLKREMARGATLTEVCVRFIQPAMYEVGRLWQESQLSVAREHLATATANTVISRAFFDTRIAEPNGRKAFLPVSRGITTRWACVSFPTASSPRVGTLCTSGPTCPIGTLFGWPRKSNHR